MNRKIEVDLSGPKPLVRCDDEIVEGVTRAEIILTPTEVPMLVLTVCVFEVAGGKLPSGWD